MDITDSGHRPHAVHTGQEPTFPLDYGPAGLKVSLDAWGPQENLLARLWNELQANWGDRPERVDTDADLSHRQVAYVESCFAGGTLPQVLEGIALWFTVDGVSRACTHQLVRTRIGAAVMQHGGRDNDWRHRGWTMPETIRRACVHYDRDSEVQPAGERLQQAGLSSLAHCLQETSSISSYLDRYGKVRLQEAIIDYLYQGRQLYGALVDAGIPWQDARRLLPIGTQTYLHINYTYLALRGVLANRLEFVMDWEINCVAQLMLREVKMKCHPLMSKYLMSHSDRQQKPSFAGMDSWPPDQKWPCTYDPSKRTHRAEQMPFFVLSEPAMNGGPVEWIPTNGVHPNAWGGAAA